MRKKGSMITVQGDGRTIARNPSFFKELSKTVPNGDRGDIQDDDFNAPSYNPTPVSPDVSVIPSPHASNPLFLAKPRTLQAWTTLFIQKV